MSGKPNKQDLEQLLSSYIDGECSEQERLLVEQALQRDPQLRALYTELLRTIEAVRATPGEATPSHVRQRILAQLERRALLDAAPRGLAAGRSSSWARLGLVAAAMLVAAAGATWWYRTHQSTAPYQMAMAPTQPERDAARKAVPAPPPVQSGGAGAGPELARKVAEPSAAAPLGATGRLPARGLAYRPPAAPDLVVTPQPPGSARLGVPATPRVPVVADRSGSSASYSLEAPATAPQGALAMRDQHVFRSKAPGATAGQTLGIKDQSEPAPHAERESAQATGQAIAAAPAAQESAPARAAAEQARLPAPEALPPESAASADHEAVTGVAVARVAPVPAAPAAAGPTASHVAGLPVTRLQITVDDAWHVAAAADYVRALVAREGGAVYPQPDPSTIIATVPTDRRKDLDDAIVLAPGVTETRSSALPPTDPLARQAASAAAVQWMEAARQFLEALDSTWQFEQAPPPESAGAGRAGGLVDASRPSSAAAGGPFEPGLDRTATFESKGQPSQLHEQAGMQLGSTVVTASRPIPTPAPAERYLWDLAAQPAVPRQQAAFVIVIEPAAAEELQPAVPAASQPPE